MNAMIFKNVKGYSTYYHPILALPLLSTVFFLLYWTFNISLFSYIGMALYFIPLLFLNISNCFRIYYFLLPNISLFKLSLNSLAFSSIFLLIILAKVLLNKETRVSLLSLTLIITYFISSFLTYLLAKNNLSILTQEIRVIFDILVVFSIIAIFKDSLQRLFDQVSHAFISGCVVSALCGVIYIMFNDIQLTGYRLEAINGDPNYFSLCMAFSVSLLLLKINLNGSTNIDITIIMILTIFGLMSLSRGYLLAMIINILFFIYLFGLTPKINSTRKIFIATLLIGSFSFMWGFLGELYSNFKERTTSMETSGGSGRIEIWEVYIKATFSDVKNFLFGIGSPTPELFSSDHFSVQHNIFLELFTGKGVVGTIIVVLLYTNLFKLIKKYSGNKNNNIIAFIPLCTIFIGFMFLNGLVSDIGIMTIFLGFLATNIYSEQLHINASVNKGEVFHYGHFSKY